jgi:hypothetical protein
MYAARQEACKFPFGPRSRYDPAPMNLSQPCLRRGFGVIFPPAANDNRPVAPKPRTLRQTVSGIIDEPVGFALYLLMTGSVAASGFSLLVAVAARGG